MRSYEYTIVKSRAKMPSKCFGGNHYVHIAVLEYDPLLGYPSRIDTRQKCVRRIVRIWARQHEGSTDRCAAAVAYANAESLVEVCERRQVMRALAVRAGYVSEPAARLDGDYLACRRPRGEVVRRYDAEWKLTGYSVRMPADISARFGKWEHGATYAACQAEIRRKRALIDIEAAREKETRHEARRVHLATIMCARLQVTYQHARSAGLCDAGIRAYCASHGLSVESGAPAAILRATGDVRALRAIEAAARELIAARKSA